MTIARQFYVYVYSDPTTELPFYVGKGQGFRYRRHLFPRGHNRAVRMKVQQIREHGGEPQIERLFCADENEAFALERALIQIMGRRSEGGLLFNIAEGGEATTGFTGRKHSEESKERIRQKMLGRYVSPEAREKQRAAGLTRDVSHLHSAESIKRRVAAMATPEFRKKASDAQKRTMNVEHLRRISALGAAKIRGTKRVA